MSGTDQGLRKKLERHVEDLPVLPTAIAKVMTLDPADDRYFGDVRKIIEADPSLSARILAAANSAASAPRAPITSLLGALTRIGSTQAANLVLAISVTRVFAPRDPWEKSLWRHAVQVAQAARALAVRSRDPEVDPDEAYTCGLLHDVGRFVMFLEDPDRLRTIGEGDWDTPEALVAMERSICGLTHSEVGAMACTKWRLPDTLVHVVREHHALPKQLAGRLAKLTALVRFADFAMFPSAMPGTPGRTEADDETLRRTLEPKLPAFLRIAVHELRAALDSATAEADVIAQAIGVG